MKIILRPVTAHTPDEINVPHRVEIPELGRVTTAPSATEALSRAYLAVLAHRGASSTDPAFSVEWRPATYESADGETLVERRVGDVAPDAHLEAAYDDRF